MKCECGFAGSNQVKEWEVIRGWKVFYLSKKAADSDGGIQWTVQVGTLGYANYVDFCDNVCNLWSCVGWRAMENTLGHQDHRRGIHSVSAQLYGNLGSIFNVSTEVLTSWRGCKIERALISRFLKFTPPIRVSIGAYFYADKELVLTSLGIVAENSVTLLVGRGG